MLTIIGITRFSLVTNSTLGDFVATRGGSRADAEAAVFASPRMKSRFQLFGALTLPSMAALARQSDNFHYLLMISSRLPLRWKLKLKTYVWRYPWCRIIELQPEECRHWREMTQLLTRANRSMGRSASYGLFLSTGREKQIDSAMECSAWGVVRCVIVRRS
jgi:hypothetical protein